MVEFINRTKASKETNLSYLGRINSSAKLIKNEKVSGMYTYILYLAPAKESGYNVCPMATEECKAGCLNTSGRVKMDLENMIVNARIRKTKLFFENRKLFMNWMFAEIESGMRQAERKDMGFSIRLNGTSDINWVAYKHNGKNVFETFPTVQFYDYTKVASRFNKLPQNYHLTYSYTGRNVVECMNVLSKGNNVAVVFNIPKGYELPTEFMGYPVVDGDLTDYRPDDGNGVIVGLRWKEIKNRIVNEYVKNSVFVVQPKDLNFALRKVA